MTANRSTVGALRVVLGIDTAAFEGGLTKAQSHLRRVGRQMQRVGDQMRGVGLALSAAVIGATTAAAAAVSRVSDEIVNLAAEAETAGVSFRAFQELAYAAERNEVSLEALTDGLKELQLRANEFIQTGAGSGAEAFQRLGYTADDLREKLKEPDKLFEDIIARLQQLDAAAQIRMSDEIFGGTGGEQFVRFLDDGVDALRRWREAARASGTLIPEEAVGRARAFQESLRTLQDQLRALTVTLVNSGFTEWISGVITGIAGFTRRVVEAAPGLIKWAAIIGGAALVLGGLLVAIGSVVSAVGAIIPVFTGLAAAVTKAGGAFAILQNAMTFLVANPWVAVIGAIAVVIGIVATRTREARGAADDYRRSNEALHAATEAYAEAARAAALATGEEAEEARRAAQEKRDLAVAAREAARAKLAEAAATLAVVQAEAARFNDFERFNIRGDRPGSYAESGRLSRRLREAQANVDAVVAAIRSANAAISEADAAIEAAAARPDFIDLYDRSGGSSSSGPSAEDLAYQRETMRLQAQLAAAQAKQDTDRVRALEDILDRRQRIEAYEGAGLETAAAQIAADRDRALIAKAREAAQRRALSDREDELDLQIAQIDGDQRIIDLMERRRDRAQLIAHYESLSLKTAEATARANADLLRIEQARARNRVRLLEDARAAHALTLAELSGNERLARQLRAQAEARSRADRYEREFGWSAERARETATGEVELEESARDHGARRDLFASAFSEGVRAAWTEDLGAFLSNQFGTIADRAFTRMGEKIYDHVFGRFDAASEGAAQGAAHGAAAAPAITTAGNAAATAMGAAITLAGKAAAKAMGTAIAGASAGGDGKGVAGLVSGISKLFPGLPKFSKGGSILPSGASSMDSQLVAFWKSPRERVNIGTPAQLSGDAGGVVINFAPVIHAEGAGPREVDMIKAEVERMRRDIPAIAVGAVANARDRRIIA